MGAEEEEDENPGDIGGGGGTSGGSTEMTGLVPALSKRPQRPCALLADELLFGDPLCGA